VADHIKSRKSNSVDQTVWEPMCKASAQHLAASELEVLGQDRIGLAFWFSPEEWREIRIDGIDALGRIHQRGIDQLGIDRVGV
jgi:hypothetical protein